MFIVHFIGVEGALGCIFDFLRSCWLFNSKVSRKTIYLRPTDVIIDLLKAGADINLQNCSHCRLYMMCATRFGCITKAQSQAVKCDMSVEAVKCDECNV